MRLSVRCAIFFAFSVLAVPTAATGAEKDEKPNASSQAAPGGSKEGLEKDNPPKRPNFEGSMTLDKMNQIIKRIDNKAQTPRKGLWRFSVEEKQVVVITDEMHNRMRILVPIVEEKELSDDQFKRLMQANFDSALDGRYAIAKGILWSTYIHPLKALHSRQFISAIGQTVNLALTFGTTYSSGALVFGGGDSKDLLRRQLIDRLLKKGLPI